jgi:DNA-binding FrmR family transcriptional regulator
MVHLDDFIDDGDEGPDVAADFAALKGCLKALADAIASTNLAVLNGAQGDAAAATQRVQASVAALKRFHDGFKILDAGAEDETPVEDED